MKQKTLREDAHSREAETCRKRPRSARECARAHSFLCVIGNSLEFPITCSTPFIFQEKEDMDHSEKLKLYGFNNLTKALSFNIYDVCYAKTPREQKDYIAYIDQQYNSERLTRILTSLTDMIGATGTEYFPAGLRSAGGFGHASDCGRLHDAGAGGDAGGASGQEPCDGPYLSGIPSGDLSGDLPGGYRRGDLRGDHAAFHTGLPDRFALIRTSSRWTTGCAGFTRDVDGKKLFMDREITLDSGLYHPRKRCGATMWSISMCTRQICSIPR